MTLHEFKASLRGAAPPVELAPVLAALWWAQNDSWDKAHRIVMDENNKECAWVHAHLHRAEGDLDNARYWYRQAQRTAPAISLADEWAEITRTLLDES